jgi:hypothetical protein
MLSERQCELLTGYLDGQLSPRHHKTALRLLRHSEEARTLLRQLQGDARALHGLPRRSLPADFGQKVVQTAVARGLRPGVGRAPRPSGLPTWAGVAAAAAVLLAVTAGSFVYFRGLQPPDEMAGLGPFDLPPPPKVNPEQDPWERMQQPRERVPLSHYAQVGARKQLEQELRKQPAHHLDLAAGDPGRTVEQLQGAFEDTGIRVLLAPPARKSLKRKRPNATYVVYAENVSPEELTQILGRVGGKDSKGPKAVDGGLLIDPMSDAERGRLSKLLGVTLAELRSPKAPKAPLREPIEDPEGQPGKVIKAPKTPDRFAVVLASEGGSNASLEVQQFLSRRERPRPGTLQVYLVVHDEASA